MTHVKGLLPSSLPYAGRLLILSVLTLGLAGCYTQLRVADEPDHRNAHTKQADDGQTYADEYRREYRRENRGSANKQRTVADRQRTVVEHRYTYESTFYDPFFHDPFFYDVRRFYPRHGSFFSFSLYFGNPHFHSWRHRLWYDSGYHSGFHRPFGNYYLGNQYFYGDQYYYGNQYYYGDVSDDRA
ncbi:MAG: hypothetical protein BRD53_02925, partial [Bacteroidetes bacterium SW_7_64_58]